MSALISDPVASCGLEIDHCRAPRTARPTLVAVREHRRVRIQDGMNESAKGSCSLAVDNANVQNTPAQTLLDVLGHERFHVLWREGVEIKRAINRQFEGAFIHDGNIASSCPIRARSRSLPEMVHPVSSTCVLFLSPMRMEDTR